MSVNTQQVPRRAGPRPRGLEKERHAPAATGTRGCPNERTFPCAAYEDNENLAQAQRKETGNNAFASGFPFQTNPSTSYACGVESPCPS